MWIMKELLASLPCDGDATREGFLGGRVRGRSQPLPFALLFICIAVLYDETTSKYSMCLSESKAGYGKRSGPLAVIMHLSRPSITSTPDLHHRTPPPIPRRACQWCSTVGRYHPTASQSQIRIKISNKRKHTEDLHQNH